MLRKTLSVLMFALMAVTFSYAQQVTDSSLIRERNDLYFELLDLRNTGDMQQKIMLEQALQQADELLKSDNRLIDTLMTRSAAVDSLSDQMDIRKTELDSLKLQNESFQNYVMYGVYGAAGAGLIIVLLLVLVIIFSSAKAKLRKKIKGTDELEKENEDLKTGMSSVEKMMQQNADMIGKLNRTLEMKESRMKDLQAIVDGAESKYNDKCAEYDKTILELREHETQLIGDKIKANSKASETVSQLESRIHELETALNEQASGPVDNSSTDEIHASYREKISALEMQLNEAITERDSRIRQLEQRLNESSDDDGQQIRELGHQLNDLRNDRDRQVSELEQKISEIQNGSENRIRELEYQLNEMHNVNNEKVHELEQKLAAALESENRIRSAHARSEQDLMQQLSEAQARASEYESILNDPEKRAFRDQEFNKKLSEMELRVIKLGKVDRMLKDGLITQEEYASMKGKILEDF